MKTNYFKTTLFFFINLVLLSTGIDAQNQNNDTTRSKYLYRPERNAYTNTQDTVHEFDSTQKTTVNQDSGSEQQEIINDSIRKRLDFMHDSVLAREIFIRDSIIARENFVRDSIMERNRKIDSLTVLKYQIERLFKATLWATSEPIIIDAGTIQITDNLQLTDYKYTLLPYSLNKPYTPWSTIIPLTNKNLEIHYGNSGKQITGLKTNLFNCSYTNTSDGKILEINHQQIITINNGIRYFKEPVDSVFYDRTGKILRIKRYGIFYSTNTTYQRGSYQFTHLEQVKQFEYNSSGIVSGVNVVDFCEDFTKDQINKVCKIIAYSISKNGDNYLLTRKNDPQNQYSDGTYTFEFDDELILKSVSFINQAKTEDWKTFITLNDKGNVKRYATMKKGRIVNALSIVYNTDNPQAKYPVETISISYSDDGADMYEMNNTTGKQRSRDPMTLEWGPWE